MAKLEPKYTLAYVYGGDRVRDWGRGYILNQKQLFEILNALRTNQEVTGVAPEAYELKIEDDKIFVRDSANEKWLKLLDVAENGGLKSSTIGKMQAGNESDMSTDSNKDGDTYLTLDTGKLYYWKNNKWQLLLSLNVSELNGYDNLVKKDADVVTTSDSSAIVSDAQKVVRTNDDGKMPVDITGSSAQIAGINVDVTELEDGQVLTYRKATNTWVMENKSTAGAGKALALKYGNSILANYTGAATADVDLEQIAPNLLRRNRNYGVGSVVHSPHLPSYEYLECTKAGVTADSEPTLSGLSPLDNVTDGSCVFVVREKRLLRLLDMIYPVGTVKITTKDEEPFKALGFGEWKKIAAGRTLIGSGKADSGTSYNVGATGGEETHVLSGSEMPSHTHHFDVWTTTNGAHHHGVPYAENTKSATAYWGLYDGNRNHSGSNDTDWDNPLMNTSTDGNHNHHVTGDTWGTGSSAAHNNMQPYLAVCIWERTK